MSIALTVNGVVYDYPETGDDDWGPDATDWAAAVTTGMLQKAGGLFQLLSELDFGTAFGVKSLYYKTRTANPADSGQFRLARADVINWRNNANSGNLSLGVSASDVLQFNGADIQGSISVSDTATIDLTFLANVLSADVKSDSLTNTQINSAAAIAYSKLALTGSILNADINASAAIAYSKLAALTVSRAVATDGSGFLVAATTTATELGYVNGVTSAIQTQIDSKQATGNYITALTGDVTASGPGSVAATIGSNKVTNAMLAQVATAIFKGRTTASTGNVEDLTVTQATAMLNNMVGDSGSGGTKGLVPAPASGDATKFLSGAGTWTNPAGAGDVVGPASATDNALTVFDGTTGKLIKNSVIIYSTGSLSGIVGITNSGTIVSTGSITSKNSLILEDPGAGTNTMAFIAGTVSSSYSLTWPTAVAATANSALVSSTGGVISYIAALSTNTNSSIVLRDGSGNFSAGTITAALSGNASTATSATSATSATTATNIAGGSGGTIPYQSAAGTTAMLANGTAGQVLKSAGGTAAPVWTATPVTAPSQIIRGSSASLGGSSSGDTKCVNFSAAISSTGTDITFTARTTTTADKYTINTAGIYSIWCSPTDSAGASITYGITINSSGTSTNVQSLAASQVPAISTTYAPGVVTLSCSVFLAVNDVVRLQTETGATPSGSANTRFGITRVD